MSLPEPTSPGQSFWLQNMSSRPRTQVDWTINPIRWPERPSGSSASGSRARSPASRAIVVFDWDVVAAEYCARPGGQRPSWHRLRASTEQLEENWRSWPLRGAVLVYPWRDAVKPSVPPEAAADGGPRQASAWATWPPLVVNVLGRARGGLLLARFPLTLNADFLERRLATDDPRLVRLAQATGVKGTRP